MVVKRRSGASLDTAGIRGHRTWPTSRPRSPKRAGNDCDLSTARSSLRVFVLRYFRRDNHTTTGDNVNVSTTGAISAYTICWPVTVPAINPRTAVAINDTGFSSTR